MQTNGIYKGVNCSTVCNSEKMKISKYPLIRQGEKWLNKLSYTAMNYYVATKEYYAAKKKKCVDKFAKKIRLEKVNCQKKTNLLNYVCVCLWYICLYI